jgi:hypothetical protein
MTESPAGLPLPRAVAIALAALAAAALLVALIYEIVQIRHHRSVDGALKQAAERALPTLRLSGRGYDAEPTFYRVFQRFVYDERHALVTRTVHALGRSQWAQIQVLDARSIPPQQVLLNLPGHQPVQIDSATVNAALQHGRSGYAGARSGSTSLRAYLTPIQPPAVLQGQDVYAVLEVLQPA